MVDSTNFLDPVQALIDYVNDIKPYHTKVIETLVEYVGQENVDTNIREKYLLNIGLDYSYNIPFNETYLAFGGETVISTTIPTYSGNIFTGSPPIKVYNFNNTIVYLNGVFQNESTGGSPPTGDYTISGANEITLTNPLALNDEVEIYTATQWQDAPNTCNNAGFGAATFDDPDSFPIVSPDPAILMADFPAMTTNSFIITGDQRDKFDPNNNTTFQIESFTENSITGAQTPAANNSGTFTVTNSIFTEGTNTASAYTTVYIIGVTGGITGGLTPPTTPALPNVYVSLVSTGDLSYTKILSYSNVLKDYGLGSPVGSPPSLLQDPDEGLMVSPITDITSGTSGSFSIVGDFRSSNVFNGDEFSVIGSTNNDGNYNIVSMTYNTLNNKTTFVVSTIGSGTVDGDLHLTIPSNVFFVAGDYTDFFKQGSGIGVTTGTAQGTYTTLNSKFINNQTQIRAVEDIITSTGDPVLNVPTANTILVSGNQVSKYTSAQLNIISSSRNNGLYTVSSLPTFNGTNTTITVTETLDSTDNTGTVHKFTAGLLQFRAMGFGQIPKLCEIVPDTIIKVGIDDVMSIAYAGSPAEPMYQYVIVNTTDTTASPAGVNTISVYGDATSNLINGGSVAIIHSTLSPNNDGTYTINSVPVYNSAGNYTTFNVLQAINSVGNSGGWIEGVIT